MNFCQRKSLMRQHWQMDTHTHTHAVESSSSQRGARETELAVGCTTEGPTGKKCEIPEGGPIRCTASCHQGLTLHAQHTGDLGCTERVFPHLPYKSTINWHFLIRCVECFNGSQLWLIFKRCSPNISVLLCDGNENKTGRKKPHNALGSEFISSRGVRRGQFHSFIQQIVCTSNKPDIVPAAVDKH